MAMHYRPARTTGTACGRGGAYPLTTPDTNLVSCRRCMATERFRRVANVATLTVVHNPEAIQVLTDGLTADQIAVKVVLDRFIKAAHDEAVEQGVCGTYDEIMENIQGHLPAWYEMPAVPTKWGLEVSTRYLDDRMTEDEAYKHIAENIKDYISLDSY
jgi:hypothetical protein